MEIRTCKSCGEYKYIQDEGMCRECNNSDTKYCIVVYYGLMPTIYESGLTKEEAEEMIDDKPGYFRIREC